MINLDKNKKNNALEYLPKPKSNYELVSPLYYEIQRTLYKGCSYYPNILCDQNDYHLFNLIKAELSDKNNIVEWSAHHKIENPTISKTFNEIVDKLAEFYNIKVLATRLNYYTDTDWKPFHHDSHAYHSNEKEDITIGCSLGSSRNLVFKHAESDIYFDFPQNNGDIFSFDYQTNIKFKHGISKLKKKDPSNVRISIIIWGKTLGKS